MKRFLTAAILIPIILAVVLKAPVWLLFAVTATVAALCYREYCGIVAAWGVDCFGPVGYAAGLALMLVGRHEGLLITAFALAAMTLAMAGGDLRQSLPRASALLLGVVYIFGPWSLVLPLRAASPWWLSFALMLSWLGDAAAYYVGRNLGRRQLAPVISPKKTWEGSAASVAASALFGYFFLKYCLPSVPPLHAVVLAALANAAGQVGDLAESALKRGAGVKDSGALLPGHGGMLDRVDSTLFALPVVYAYLLLLR